MKRTKDWFNEGFRGEVVPGDEAVPHETEGLPGDHDEGYLDACPQCGATPEEGGCECDPGAQEGCEACGSDDDELVDFDGVLLCHTCVAVEEEAERDREEDLRGDFDPMMDEGEGSTGRIDCANCGAKLGTGSVSKTLCPGCEDDTKEKPVDHKMNDHHADMKGDRRLSRDQKPAVRTEGTGFDKFMDRILTEEKGRPGIKTLNDSPQRARQLSRQERPLGRIRMGVK